MSNTSNRGDKRSARDIDIATPGYAPTLRTYRNVILWLIVFGLALIVFYLQPDDAWIYALLIFGGALLVFVGSIAWFTIFKRGVLTWMRLAKQPAQMIARGDRAGAERLFAKALTRARRFAPRDYRRGMMLCELAMYAKFQGRYQESLALYEETVQILGNNLAKNAVDYFVALNNHAICFIHLRDFTAAQKLLEKALDLTLAARKRDADKFVVIPLKTLQYLQFVLHLNLAFLFMEMHDLAEAELQLREADSLAPILSKRTQAHWHDHYIAICALWEYESGNFAEAEAELAEARNPDYPACVRARARIHLVRQEFAKAEKALRKYQDSERKKGTIHRPELLKNTLDLAASLFGQAKHDEAFASLQEARSIVADFALPPDAAWRKTLETWLQRARELNKADVAASLEADLQAMPAMVEQRITILEKFRIQPPTQA